MNDINTILILNASEGILQILVGYENDSKTILAHQEWNCPQNSTEKLTPLIKEIYKKLELPLQSISKIACVVGAGSFTGIRLCLTTAQALARVLSSNEKKVMQVSIDFLEALAYNAPLSENIHVRVITHAKRNLVHSADFIYENLKFQQIENTKLVSPNEAFEELLEKNIPYFLLGSGVEKISHDEVSQIHSTPAKMVQVMDLSKNLLNPRVLLDLANNSIPVSCDLNPEYVRSCDAVDNLEHISKKLGNNPEEAFKQYYNFVK